jgi:hypothetical protein
VPAFCGTRLRVRYQALIPDKKIPAANGREFEA